MRETNWKERYAEDQAVKLWMKIRKVASTVVKGAIIMALAGSIIANFMIFYMLPKLAVH